MNALVGQFVVGAAVVFLIGCAPCRQLAKCEATCAKDDEDGCARAADLEFAAAEECDVSLDQVDAAHCVHPSEIATAELSAVEWYSRACQHGEATGCRRADRLRKLLDGTPSLAAAAQKREAHRAEFQRWLAQRREQRRRAEEEAKQKAEAERQEREHERQQAEAEQRRLTTERNEVEDAINTSLQQERAKEAKALLENAGDLLDEPSQVRFRRKIEQLERAEDAQKHFGLSIASRPRAVVARDPIDIFGAPHGGESIDRLGADSHFLQVARVGDWLGVAPTDLGRAPSWCDVIGWIRAREVVDEATYQRQLEAARKRQEHEAAEQWKPQNLRRRLAPLVVDQLKCRPVRFEKSFDLGEVIETHGVCRHQQFGGWPWNFVCFCYRSNDSCTCDLRDVQPQ